VLDVAERLGYRRNELARAVVTGKNPVLGVLARTAGPEPQARVLEGIPEPKARILEGILEEAGAHGYFIKLLHHAPEEDVREVARRCVEQRLAGVVVLRASQSTLSALHEELARYQIPTILVDNNLSQRGAINVTSDDVQGCRLAVEHLVALGHRRIAQMEGRRDPNPLLREAAFRRAMGDVGLDVPDGSVVYADWLLEQEERATTELFPPGEDRPTALFCSAGDVCAAIAIRTLRRMGLHVPADVSVVGYSDLLVATCTDPPLTTVGQPFYEMGRVAVSQLLALLEAESAVPVDDPMEHLLPTQLITRASTGPAPIR
jgi:LacI family transcriptional regulator